MVVVVVVVLKLKLNGLTNKKKRKWRLYNLVDEYLIHYRRFILKNSFFLIILLLNLTDINEI